nr:hypothetical protein [Planctomycetota bacterium]
MSSFKLPASFANADEFRARLQEIDPQLDCSDGVSGWTAANNPEHASAYSDVNPMAQSVQIGGRTLANRWAVHPMEGWDATEDGQPSADTLRRWYRFGLSGAAMVWGGEAYAVCPEGRANPNQLHQGSHDDPQQSLRELLAELRRGQTEAGLDPVQSLVGLQLTHSGRWSRPTSAGPAPRIVYRHPFLDERVGLTGANSPASAGAADNAILRDE